MVKSLQTQKGFSLVELMIVVAIIGILATIAVPNFQKMQGRARQSEAKAALSAMYSGQKAFFAEWSFYTGDLRDIGYVPEGVMNYVVGHNGTSAAGIRPPNFVPSTSDVTGAALAADSCTDSRQNVAGCTRGKFNVYAPAAFAANAAVASCGMAAGTAPTATTFVSSANGRTSTTSGRDDVWAVDQNKNFCNTQDGLN